MRVRSSADGRAHAKYAKAQTKENERETRGICSETGSYGFYGDYLV